MKILAISDTHGRHDQLDLPEADILIHAGDVSMMGRDKELDSFGKWLESQKNNYKYRVLVAGNHDFMFEKDEKKALSFLDKEVIYLDNSVVTLEGFKFYGSPQSVMFNNWAFMQYEADLAKTYSFIPQDTDVLITHGPALGILDMTLEGKNVGSIALYNRIKELKKLKVHICGHIHEHYGFDKIDDVEFYNVSCLDRYYTMKRCNGTLIEVNV